MSVYSTRPQTKEELRRQLNLIAGTLEEHLEAAAQFQDVDKQALENATTFLRTGLMWFHRGVDNDWKF